MKYVIDLLLSFFIIIFCTILEVYIYSLISPKKVKLKNKFPIIIISFAELILHLLINNPYRLIISFLVLFLLYKLSFKENSKITLVKTLMIFLVMICSELILSIIITIYFDFLNFSKITFETLIVKNLFSILVMLFMLLIFSIKNLNKFAKKIIYIVYNKNLNIIRFFLILINIFTISLLFSFSMEINKRNYFSNLIFIIIVLIFCYLIMKSKSEVLRAEEKQKILIEYLSRYEDLIDKSRINQHEILNNLLILSSYKNKNTKEYMNILNEIISYYDKNGYSNLKNINNLPSGIKGILYYKINDMEKYNINYNFYYSKQLNKIWNKIGDKNYMNLCRLFGIFIDNAIEAAKDTEEKTIVVDIYKENNQIIIYIQNSIQNKIKINNIKKKNYSTKGANRGLGLYIAYRLQNQCKNIKLKQYTKEKLFITELKVDLNKK